jgi:hypothetical protein
MYDIRAKKTKRLLVIMMNKLSGYLLNNCNKNFWEELIGYFPFIRGGPHRKLKKQERTARYTDTKAMS